MRKTWAIDLACLLGLATVSLSLIPESTLWEATGQAPAPAVVNTVIPTVQSDPTVKFDYNIICTKAPRPTVTINGAPTLGSGDWPTIHFPFQTDPHQDLVRIKPDGTEQVLFSAGLGSVVDPVMSFDGTTVYFSYFPQIAGKPIVNSKAGADIYALNLSTLATTKITNQTWEATPLSKAPGSYGVFNFAPCPLPGNRIMYVSNRKGYISNKRNQPNTVLYSCDLDGSNVECVGAMDLGGALHPTILQDGRIVYSTQQSQGLRGFLQWSLWQIWPDGTNWGPVVSHFMSGAPPSWHFQTQTSDGNLWANFYYDTSSMGALYKLPTNVFLPNHAFGGSYVRQTSNLALPDPRDPLLTNTGRAGVGKFNWPFMPYGISSATPWTNPFDDPAPLSDTANANSPRVGKFTHPAPAPGNNLLVCYTPSYGDANYYPGVQGTICLIKGSTGTPNGPSDLRLIKQDPGFTYRQPIAEVPYSAITGLAAPKEIAVLANDGTLNPALPRGCPYGLIGTSSLYKRESYPNGLVAQGSVTATDATPLDLDAGTKPGVWGEYASLGSFYGDSQNFRAQGGDCGYVTNDMITYVRILYFKPSSEGMQFTENHGPSFYAHTQEKAVIAGEFPVRKFTNGVQPLDPDGNPDTSFLAKIQADVPHTFQGLDANGQALFHSSTWHQVRPGEIRNNCGGCHAHSQTPTDFGKTAAALPTYVPFDLTGNKVPFVATKANDQSGQQWDAANVAGVTYASGPQTVEFNRDIKPILQQFCVSCHTKSNANPPGHLVLDDTTPYTDTFWRAGVSLPGDYSRLAADSAGKFSYPADVPNGYGSCNASRYVRVMQSRRSLLSWKLHGKRADGFTNNTAPSTDPVTGQTTWRGQPYAGDKSVCDLDYNGRQCPPPGSPQLTAQQISLFDKWIDTGCLIDLIPQTGGVVDDYNPTLTVQSPPRGSVSSVSSIIFGAADYESGLNPASLSITADFPVDGNAPGVNLAPLFTNSNGVWTYTLKTPLTATPNSSGNLTVSIQDNAKNTATVSRRFYVVQGPPAPPPPVNLPALTVLRIAVPEFGAAIDPTTLSVTCCLPVDGNAPGVELASLFTQVSPGVWQYSLKTPIPNAPPGLLAATVKDAAGKTITLHCSFSRSK